MIEEIKRAVNRLTQLDGMIRIITHNDTDGITSGAIISTALKRLDKIFKISIIKQLEKNNIEMLRKENNKILFVLDMGSSHIEELSSFSEEVFIIDHHDVEIKSLIPKNVHFINPFLTDKEDISASAIAYLFAKEIDIANKDLASLAVLGMIGDFADKNLGKIGDAVIKDAENLTIKKSLPLFHSTRPLNKALEFSSIYIPGVTGSSVGALNLIREAGIKIREEGKWKTLLDLTKEELSRLLTLITLKRTDAESLIGKIYLIKFFNQLEDARELSSLINSCGRLGYADVGLAFCMGSKKAKSNAETIYSTYKHQLIAGLNWISMNQKIEGEGYAIINAGSAIKDNIIGTLISILASSFIYPENNILVGMARTDDKRIKVSARIVGHKEGDINLKKLLAVPTALVDGESGGHSKAAGCFIHLSKEKTFIELLQKELRVNQLQIKI